jgi:hypothetical protein
MAELPRRSNGDPLVAELNRRLREIHGREPHWRYFQRRGGPMFVWAVEPFGAGRLFDAPDPVRVGRYASLVYEPIGIGARSGGATSFRMADGSESLHALRRDGKARALRLFRAWEAGERRPWL